jgi:hypothetical protein
VKKFATQSGAQFCAFVVQKHFFGMVENWINPQGSHKKKFSIEAPAGDEISFSNPVERDR